MNLVDANVLIYAVNSDAPHHRRSKKWLESALSGTETVGFPWVVLLAFLRVTTRRGIFERPLSTAGAIGYVDSWLQQPPAELVVPGPNHWALLRTMVAASGTAGNLTSDAHLAALAIEGGWRLVSTDYDFQRFIGLNVWNPTG
ncbi:MAG TPA: type II toxin-antitoxin system VapC family toxin [Thermoanaerobaculia bacterium]|nr:type II toxin-antitoxin system VapC family toxin [Thermoanaerobaculia bacterium]